MNKNIKADYKISENENELIGNKFGSLTIIGINVEVSKSNRRIFCDCKCDCGKTTCVNLKNLRNGNSKTCGKCNYISFGEWLILQYGDDALDIYWDYDKNVISPFDVAKSGHTKVYMKCDKKHYHGSYIMSCNDFAFNHRCPYCSNRHGMVHEKDSFAQYHIDNTDVDFLNKYWDYDKNTLNPFEISPMSTKKIWIKCPNKDYHESYDVVCSTFSNGSRCPYCSNIRLNKYDSLGYTNEKVNIIWSDKNKKTPYEYSPVSGSKVWWVCENGVHDDYERRISRSNTADFMCPKCVTERSESILQEKVRLYLKECGYTVLNEYACNIIAKNPKISNGKGLMPYDNEVVELKLIIEVNGEQHYRATKFNILASIKNGTTPQYELHKRMLYDRYKKYIAYKNGYAFLDIPYWTSKNDEWKTIITNKINEIKQSRYKEVVKHDKI